MSASSPEEPRDTEGSRADAGSGAPEPSSTGRPRRGSGWVVTRKAAPSLPSGLRYASTWRRLGALLIDFVIGAVVGGFVLGLLSPAIWPASSPCVVGLDRQGHEVCLPLHLVNTGVAITSIGLVMAMWCLYFVITVTTMWGTIGHRLTGLVVARADTGEKLDVSRAAARWLVGFLPSIGLLAVGSILFSSVAYDCAVSGEAACAAQQSDWSLLPFLVGNAWFFVILLTTAFGRHHRGLHDRAAGSVVVRRA